MCDFVRGALPTRRAAPPQDERDRPAFRRTTTHMPEPLVAEDAEPPSRIRRTGKRPSVSTLRTTTEAPAAQPPFFAPAPKRPRSEEHTSELQSLMRISYAVFCLKKKK